MSDNVNRCPFCGGESIHAVQTTFGEWYAECLKCRAEGSCDGIETTEAAIHAFCHPAHIRAAGPDEIVIKRETGEQAASIMQKKGIYEIYADSLADLIRALEGE